MTNSKVQMSNAETHSASIDGRRIEGEIMGHIKIFTKAECPKCPAMEEIGQKLKREGIPVFKYDVDTTEGLAEASFYSILSTPSLLIEDEEKEVAAWRGTTPSIQEVKRYLFRDHP